MAIGCWRNHYYFSIYPFCPDTLIDTQELLVAELLWFWDKVNGC
jgi:hypothetical protein